ncbi:MAG: zinc-ribbon domain-containing protein [Candidatus Odinarchaeota archaeon]
MPKLNLAYVPFIVANRRNRGYRSSAIGRILGIIVMLIIFGFLFLVFFNNFDGFMSPMIFMISGFGIFFVIIIVIAVAAVSMSTAYKKPKEDYIKPYEYQPQQQTPQSNPYIIRESIPKQPEIPKYEENEREIPIFSEINYCKYCGSKVDKNAIFCDQCGTKL